MLRSSIYFLPLRSITLACRLPCRVCYENREKYFRTDDRNVLEETYEAVIKSVFNLLPYPDAVPALLQEVEKQNPKAKNAQPEDFVDAHFVRELGQSGFTKALLAGRWEC